jgi:ELWxxDGT repeat protein
VRAQLLEGEITLAKPLALFAGKDKNGSENLWVTDGTSPGTRELTVTGIYSFGLLYSGVPDFTFFEGQAFFDGNDSSARQNLWLTDGTVEGTGELTIPGQYGFGLAPSGFTVLGGKLLFAGYDDSRAYNLWVSNGTAGGTKEILAAGASSSGLINSFSDPDFTIFGNKVLFNGRDTSNRQSLWVTNGTKEGTSKVQIADASGGLFSFGGSPGFTVLGSKVLFAGRGDDGRYGLWATNGTTGGTSRLHGTTEASNGFFYFRVDPDITVIGNGRAVFEGNDTIGHKNLWITNGASKGTTELTVRGADPNGLFYFENKEIRPNFTPFGGKVLFVGENSSAQIGLWISNGTSDGTREIKPAKANIKGLFWNGTIQVAPDFTLLGDKVLFAGLDEDGHIGLWVTDGTDRGTVELKVQDADPSGLFYNNGPVLDPGFTRIGASVLFNGFDLDGHENLWITDGTGRGTRELKAAAADPKGLSPSDITAIPLPPPPPSALALAAGSDGGVKGDRITNVTRPAIVGKGEAGDKVTLLDGAKAIGTGTVGAKGTWSVTPGNALVAGVHTLTARESSAAGVSGKSAPFILTIKLSAPAPSALAFAVAADKVKLGDTIRVTGKGEAGDRVSLFDGAKLVGTAKVAAGGGWSITTAKPLAIGGHSLTASETDVAGNKSKATPAQSLTFVRAAPNRAVFVGTSGQDQFAGGGGSDVFKFSASALAASDVVKGGAGADYLTLTSAGAVRASGVAGVETYYLAGAAANSLSLVNGNFAGAAGATITIVGGAKGNRLSEAAVSAADRAILRGGAGADILIAGRHATMTGGAGNDRFELTLRGSPATPDRNTIADFEHGADKLGLAEAGFGLGAAPVAATLFRANPTGAFATTAQRFAYNTATGVLRFDADGKGGGSSPLTIATLGGHPTLSAGDLFFFAGASG